MQKIILSWSGGKDSMLALHKLVQDQRYKVVGLLTTFAGPKRQINFHFTDEDLVKQQAQKLNLPLFAVYTAENANNNEYIAAHLKKLEELQQQQNIEAVAFGDIFLQSIRNFREEMLKQSGLQPVFPLWGEKPSDLLQSFFQHGYSTIITSVDMKCLPAAFAGQELTQELLKKFPDDTDLTGENGEYHTFVFDGPLFSEQVKFTKRGKSYTLSFQSHISQELAVQLLESAINKPQQQ